MFFIILILSIFGVLFYRYYSGELAENPRFVSADYQSLEEEASRIQSSYGTENKNAKDVFVLTYHAITKEPTDSEFRIYYEDFKETMFELKREGYQTITLEEFYAFMNGEKELPDKSFLLTFDDGAKQSYYNSDPILEALGYNAVLSIITSHSIDAPESSYYLNHKELIEAHETGRWEIVSHTDSLHYRLQTNEGGEIAPAMANKLWIPDENRIENDEEYYERIREDLEISDKKIEGLLNKSVSTFVLPYGDFGEKKTNYPEANKILLDLTTSKYKMVFYEFPYKYKIYRSNYNDESGKGSYIISRIPADYLSREPEEIIDLIEAMTSKELPYYEDYKNQDNWVRISGTASFSNDSITLFPESNRGVQSMTSYIDGSYLWKDYSYSLRINSEAESINLVSRYKDPHNFIACKYQENSAWIIQVDGGSSQKTIVKQIIPDNKTISEGSKLSIDVLGNSVACYIDGKLIVSSEIENIPEHGGVGIKIDGFDESYSFAFSEISVTPLKNSDAYLFKNKIQNETSSD